MSPLSPTRLAVAQAEIEKRIIAARAAGDLAELPRCAAELTALIRAYYGTPATR